jgi:hypothetical protein
MYEYTYIVYQCCFVQVAVKGQNSKHNFNKKIEKNRKNFDFKIEDAENRLFTILYAIRRASTPAVNVSGALISKIVNLSGFFHKIKI